MKITLEMLREKNACADGLEWVEKNLPSGAEYRQFIEALEAGRKFQWVDWLIAHFGPEILAEKWRIDAILKATEGKNDSARIGSSGYYAQIGSSGDAAQIGSSGSSAHIEAKGKNSIIAAAGYGSQAKAGENGCIALAYWDEKAQRPRMVIGYVGEGGISADVWYVVKDGQFAAVE